MANESEGVLDVLREWRDMVCYSKGPVHPLCHGAIMKNLDRIEAAWTREREALEAHVRSLQSQLKVAYSCGEQPQGNAAAMREAVEATVNAIAEPNEVLSALLLMEAVAKCKTALTIRPRNCDRFKTSDAAWQEFFLEYNKTHRLTDPIPDCDDYGTWLFTESEVAK